VQRLAALGTLDAALDVALGVYAPALGIAFGRK
jgi:hypothetical protein